MLRWKLMRDKTRTSPEHSDTHLKSSKDCAFFTEAICWLSLCCGPCWFCCQKFTHPSINQQESEFQEQINQAILLSFKKFKEKKIIFPFNCQTSKFIVMDSDLSNFDLRINISTIERFFEIFPKIDQSEINLKKNLLCLTCPLPYLLLGIGCCLSYKIENILRKSLVKKFAERHSKICQIIEEWNIKYSVIYGIQFSVGLNSTWIELEVVDEIHCQKTTGLSNQNSAIQNQNRINRSPVNDAKKKQILEKRFQNTSSRLIDFGGTT